MKSKFILNFTPTGMIPTKEMVESVPIQPAEITEQVLDAADLGANMVHLHARDKKTGQPSYAKEIYSEIINGIRKKNKHLIICVSTSGRTSNEFKHRSECLELTGQLKPDFASLTLSSMNFNHETSINTPEMIQSLAAKMLDCGIKPELEAFDPGMINYAKYLIKKGLIKPPYYFNFLLGNIAGTQADPLNLALMQSALPVNSIWSCGGLGNDQLKANALSLLSGGGVRVGLEDNIYFDADRTQLATNRELVKRIVKLAKTFNLVPYPDKEARQVLGLND